MSNLHPLAGIKCKAGSRTLSDSLLLSGPVALILNFRCNEKCWQLEQQVGYCEPEEDPEAGASLCLGLSADVGTGLPDLGWCLTASLMPFLIPSIISSLSFFIPFY